jgi:putative peptidoglycan lipid II flippase
VEFTLLRTTLNARIGRTGLAARYVGKLWLVAAVAAASAFGLKGALAGHGPRVVMGAAVLVSFAVVYGVGTLVAGVPEARSLVQRAVRRK